MGADVEYNPMTQQEISHIVKWLYTNDGGYPDKIKWRKAFIAMLEEMKIPYDIVKDRSYVDNITAFYVGNIVKRKDNSSKVGMVCRVDKQTINVRDLNYTEDWNNQDPNDWELI